MTYAAGGRQYAAVAAGGDGNTFGRGDEVVAFAVDGPPPPASDAPPARRRVTRGR